MGQLIGALVFVMVMLWVGNWIFGGNKSGTTPPSDSNGSGDKKSS